MSLSEFPPLQGQSVGNSYASNSGSFDITTFGILSGREVIDEIEERTFKEPDAEEAVKCLRRCFQVLNPGDHIAKRCPEHSSISFTHCKHAASLGQRYYHLRKIMTEKARLELLKDCLFRIKLAKTFINDLESLVLAEYRTLYAITHDCSKDVQISKLCCLNALCEDLRTQVGHWNCIKQKLHTNRWLQPILGTFYFQLENVKVTLHRLRDKAIYWLEKLILAGLQVFAHGDVDNVTHEMIWNITRGLEDFNNVLKSISMSSTSKSFMITSHLSRTSEIHPFDATLTNSYADVGEHIRAIPFTRVLNILANERSKYAAIEAHRFFTTNEEFIKVLYSGRLPDFVWTEEMKNSLERQDRDTSDYHTATGSMTSLSAAVLKVGSIKAPDLSNLISPLVEVARKEHSFAEHFLLIVCNSTNLLRRNDNPQKSRRAVKTSQSVSFGRPPRGQHTDTPVLSRSDSLRKSVSWGDSADSSIRSQLISRYMDMYWNSFGGNLLTIFYELNWGKQKTIHQSEIGSLLICNTTVIALIKHMMEHVCLKGPMFNLLKLPSNSAWDPGVNFSVSEPLGDLFPPGSVTPMLSAAKKCFHTAAYGAWDTCMSNAVASQISDKCYPCPLVNGEYSTHTGMLLRDTYQPMLNLLREQLAECSDSVKGAMMSASKSQPDIREVVALTTRLVATTSVAHHWCSVKTRQFLTSFSVSNFLLISQTDLKVLIDEAQAALYQLQKFSKAVGQRSVEDFNIAALTTAIKQLSTFCDHLQSLPGTTMKSFSKNCFTAAYDYFKETMPTGKVWRKKQEGELPKDYNVYIEHVLETVLEPVLEGVNKLKLTTQLSVVSMATVAICDAWIAFIMKEKIKFSYVGAHQLGLDVAFMKSWLRQCIANESVRQTVLDLSILKALNGAVLLLKRQNGGKRSSSRFRDSFREDSTDCVSGNDISMQGESSIHEIENDISHVGNPDDWLALRVQGGRSWKISSCFTPEACEG